MSDCFHTPLATIESYRSTRSSVQEDASRLRVGGLTALTSIDYPGELAAVVFCQGCPWRCRYCHNGHLLEVAPNHPIHWRDVIDFLARRRGLLDAVVFSGGEPTAQLAIRAAIREVRAMGYKIGLHTAGPYPGRLAEILPDVDWIGLDIKDLPDGYCALTGVPESGLRAWESVRLLAEGGVDYEVRTTLQPHWHEGRPVEIAELLAAIGVRRYALQECDTTHTLLPSVGPAGSIDFNGAVIAEIAGRFDEFIVRRLHA